MSDEARAEVERLKERLAAVETPGDYPWDEATARSAFAKLTWADVANPEQRLQPEERKACLFALSWRLEAWPALAAEVTRLRAALAVYADEGNWSVYEICDGPNGGEMEVSWEGPGRAELRPWLPAQEALSGTTAAACQPPPSLPAGQLDALTGERFDDE